MAHNFKVSVITATLNEGGNVIPFLERLEHSIKNLDYEIVVVDDNSTDGTIQLLERRQMENSYINIVVNSERKGLLFSNLEGLRVAKGEIKVILDADLQHPPEEIPRSIEKIREGYDGVVMSRFVDNAYQERRDNLRELITSLAIKLCHATLPQTRKYSDPVSGFFTLGKNMKVPYTALMEKFAKFRGYKTLIPILVENSDKKIVEIPYLFGKRNWGETKISTEGFLIFRYLRELYLYREVEKETAFEHDR